MSTTDGGPAYPYVVVTKVDGETGSPVRQEVQTGMSIRDYFAGQIMAGLCACPTVSGSRDLLALEAFKYADALLAERERQR